MRRLNLIILLAMIFIISCSQDKDANREELIIYCSHPLDLMNTILDDFKLKNPEIKVDVVTAGTGELLKRIEAERENPLGDVLWGGTLNSVKSKSDLFENYVSTNESNIYEEFQNEEGNFTRFSAIPSVIMINTNLIGNVKVEGYADLLKEKSRQPTLHLRLPHSSIWLICFTLWETETLKTVGIMSKDFAPIWTANY